MRIPSNTLKAAIEFEAFMLWMPNQGAAASLFSAPSEKDHQPAPKPITAHQLNLRIIGHPITQEGRGRNNLPPPARKPAARKEIRRWSTGKKTISSLPKKTPSASPERTVIHQRRGTSLATSAGEPHAACLPSPAAAQGPTHA